MHFVQEKSSTPQDDTISHGQNHTYSQAHTVILLQGSNVFVYICNIFLVYKQMMDTSINYTDGCLPLVP